MGKAKADLAGVSAEAPSKAGVRARIAEAVAEDYEKIKAAIWSALEAEKETWTTCTHCNRRTRVTISDMTARIRGVELALEQGLGKPPQEKAGSNSIEELAKRFDEHSVAQMSSVELAAYLQWRYANDPEARTGHDEHDRQWAEVFAAFKNWAVEHHPELERYFLYPLPDEGQKRHMAMLEERGQEVGA